ncbi:G-protein coupled receptor GRL101-like [Oscarella lobularis]|uniref:G-protein coupled receptor GRL101-like n=1 Tax=Oscarella lobularis TaxID=121494 RepID=UPI003313CF2F
MENASLLVGSGDEPHSNASYLQALALRLYLIIQKMENASLLDEPDSKASENLLCNKTWNGKHHMVINMNGDSSSETILHESVVLWLILGLLIIAGNLTVVIWRCRTGKDQRYSIPSILVVNLAASDFFLGVQLILYITLYSNWLCFLWLSPNSTTLMKSLCSICGILETTSIYASVIISATIAFYYSVILGGCCCMKHLSRRGVMILVSIEWITVIAVASLTEKLLFDQYGSVYQMEMHDDPTSAINFTENIAVIGTVTCLPLSYAPYSNPALFTIFLIVYFIMAVAMLTYMATLRKLTLSREPKPRLKGDDFRLIAIIGLTFPAWVSFILVHFYRTELFFAQMLPFTAVALCNPIIFTFTSQPFLKSIRKFKQKLFFKIGRPTRIEDVSNDSESLISTEAPPSDSEE